MLWGFYLLSNLKSGHLFVDNLSFPLGLSHSLFSSIRGKKKSIGEGAGYKLLKRIKDQSKKTNKKNPWVNTVFYVLMIIKSNPAFSHCSVPTKSWWCVLLWLNFVLFQLISNMSFHSHCEVPFSWIVIPTAIYTPTQTVTWSHTSGKHFSHTRHLPLSC